MEHGRGLERLVNFTDAISAIAITLLILPLVDAVQTAAPGHRTVGDFLAVRFPELLTFIISFAVIARLWIAHHAIFDHVTGVTRRLMLLNILWALTIVFLPLPTAMTAAFRTDRAIIAWYVGTMALSSLTLTAIMFTVRDNPVLEVAGNPVTHDMVIGALSISTKFLVALALGTIFAAVNYWALLVLLVPVPHRLLRRLHRRGRVLERG